MRPGESFVGQPIRSLQTMLQILSKDDPTLPNVIPDGIYGPDTMNAVSAFQRRYGIPVTGIADQQTWDLIAQKHEPARIRIDKAQPIEVIIDPGEVYRYGDSNPNIYLLQSMLTQLSNDHPSINAPGHTGVMDESTVDSLQAFQLIADLPVTGELDKVTWKHLVLQFTLNSHENIASRRNNF